MERRIFAVLLALVLFASCGGGGGSSSGGGSGAGNAGATSNTAMVINETGSEISIFEASAGCATPLPLNIPNGESATLEYSQYEGISFKLRCNGTVYSGSTGYILDSRPYKLRLFFDGAVLTAETTYKSLGKVVVSSQKLERVL